MALQYIFLIGMACLVIDSSDAKMFAASIEPKGRFVDTYGCCMSQMFLNPYHEPHKLTYFVIASSVAEMFASIR